MSYGQGTIIHGRLKDFTTEKDCPMALVSILRKDSILIDHMQSDEEGRFEFQGRLPGGVYLLSIEHPSYWRVYQSFQVRDGIGYDFGTISLIPKADTLQTVIVTPGYFRPRLKRDTVEYNTANLKMDVNANVEEMIGRLPGLQVDPDGTITYNGQKIQRILVDGQELFGSDLTVVTRNLNADMIARVQILDSKNKQAQFTGIDDGQRTKTLNLILKEDSKKGYFMKSEVGGDPEGYYQMGGILGSFRDKQQLMALGLSSNNGSTGFNGSTSSMGTGIYLQGTTSDPLGASAGTGIPQSVGGAVHYENDWGAKNDHWDGYYDYGHLITHPYSNSITDQILPDSVYIQNQQNISVNSQHQQAFDTHFNYNPGPLNSFEFAFGGGNMQGLNQFSSTGSSSFNDILVNTSLRMISSDVSNQNFYSGLMWRIQGKQKHDRIFSVGVNVASQYGNTGGYLYSTDQFFKSNGILQSTDTTDQRKSILSEELTLNGYLSYAEPLWKRITLGFSYLFSVNNSNALQMTYNKDDGKYDDLVDSLSDHYQDLFLTQRTTVNLQGQGKTFNYVIGGDLLQYICNQKDVMADSVIKYHYFNFSPRLTINLNPNGSQGYSFNYAGSTQLPSFAQLQPVQNNNNPLAITLGNTRLRPTYTNSFGLSFHSIHLIQLNAGLNIGLTSNAISTKTYTDSLGRQISQAVNASGSESGNLYVSLNSKLKRLDLDLGLNGNAAYSRSVNYINNLLGKNDSYTWGGGFTLAKYIPNVYNFRLNTNFVYSVASSSINAGETIRYWTQNHTAQIGFYPFKDWEINTNCDYSWRQKTSMFDNNNSVILWNAFLGRDFWDNQLTVRFQVNDILGQNAGISRSISANQISQTNSNVIGRYWMVSLQYRFTHKLKSR